VLLDARSVTASSAAIAALERPSAISPGTRSRGVGASVDPRGGGGRAAAPDLEVERGAAAGDAADRVGEGVDVGHAVLEQVAGALGDSESRSSA
jgi:hypothetical protein